MTDPTSPAIPPPPPPTYDEATGRSRTLSRRERNGIPPEARRSMEDERRPLPPGWVRSYDPSHNGHQFFVDTRCDPPRSIWHHPLDDETYLASLPPVERAHAEGMRRHTSWDDVEAESTDEEDEDHEEEKEEHHKGWGGLMRKRKDSGYDAQAAEASGSGSQHVGGGNNNKADPAPPRRLGRRIKDAVTGTTHAQREAQRAERARRERDMYQQHQVFRQGLHAAMRTGQPQLLGEDDNGRHVYLQAPGVRYPGVTNTTRLSPRAVEVYYRPGGGPRPNDQNARFVAPEDNWGSAGWSGGGYPGTYGRPYAPYARPYGMGYGGGMGLPLMAAPLFGGMMLGGLMF
ncbi:hypothetical protein F4780DRAFT_703092 [Xylariomycetidae sp. FL0641]|nr:hypothetical protein F4780DRAFT_703092 [Xylariomycetidae sp. FL0641]